MKKSIAAASPAAYVAALDGWQRECVEALRATVLRSKELEEVIKWRNLVYFANGPAIVIRAEERRVLFGFWRGQRLRDIEPALKPGGKYEMATMTFTSRGKVALARVRKLTQAAIALNRSLGDPTLGAAKPTTVRKNSRTRTRRQKLA